jgi:hypothetical protein
LLLRNTISDAVKLWEHARGSENRNALREDTPLGEKSLKFNDLE